MGPGFALFIKSTVASKHTSFLCDANDYGRPDAYRYCLLLGEYHSFELSQISAQSLSALIYLTAIITIVGFTDFYWLIRVTTPSLANTFAYVSPVIAVILGCALLHEEITILTIAAMCVILAGVAMIGNNTRQRQEEHIVRRHKI
ncbi:MAG: EamA family transporter [Nitrososphaeraceae archaeon]